MPRLPLTLFERYLLQDDRRSYPCWMLGRMRYRGALDHATLELAWAETARRHPLVAAIVQPGGFGRLQWVSAPRGPAPMTWQRGPEDGGWPTTWAPIDLTREPGFRWIIVEHEGGGEMFVQTHHAILDGGALFQVFHDLFLLYTHALGGHAELPQLQPERLRHRGRLAANGWERLKLLPTHLLGLGIAWTLLRRVVTPLVPHQVEAPDDPPPPGFPAIVGRRFSPEEFKSIRAAAKRLGTGLQELLMRDAFAALGKWRATQNIGTPVDWIRVAVPISLRHAADRRLSAANVFGVVGIDRQSKSLANRARLLRRAGEDLALVKKYHLGDTFHLLLGLHRLWPGGLRRYARSERCQATLILTNLGPLCPPRSTLLNAEQQLAVPGAVFEEVQIGGLFRPGTGATLALAYYGGGLLADLHYDPRFVTSAQAESFMQEFEAQVRLSMSESGASN